MLANFAIAGILLAIGRRCKEAATAPSPLAPGLRWVEIVLAAAGHHGSRKSGLRSAWARGRHRGAGNTGAAGRWRAPLRLQSAPDRRRAHASARHHLRSRRPAACDQQLARARSASRAIQRPRDRYRQGLQPRGAALLSAGPADFPSARRHSHPRQLERAQQFAGRARFGHTAAGLRRSRARRQRHQTPTGKPFNTIRYDYRELLPAAAPSLGAGQHRGQTDSRSRAQRASLDIRRAAGEGGADPQDASGRAASGSRLDRRDGSGDRRSSGLRQSAFARFAAGKTGARRSVGIAARSRPLWSVSAGIDLQGRHRDCRAAPESRARQPAISVHSFARRQERRTTSAIRSGPSATTKKTRARTARSTCIAPSWSPATPISRNWEPTK